MYPPIFLVALLVGLVSASQCSIYENKSPCRNAGCYWCEAEKECYTRCGGKEGENCEGSHADHGKRRCQANTTRDILITIFVIAPILLCLSLIVLTCVSFCCFIFFKSFCDQAKDYTSLASGRTFGDYLCLVFCFRGNDSYV